MECIQADINTGKGTSFIKTALLSAVELVDNIHNMSSRMTLTKAYNSMRSNQNNINSRKLKHQL